MKKAFVLIAILVAATTALAVHYVPPQEYGTAFTLHFSIYDSNSPWDFYKTAPAADDIKIRKDGGTWARATNAVTDLDNTMSLVLTATEMQAKCITVDVNDETAPALFGSDTWVIYTYGKLGVWNWIDANDGVNVDEVRGAPPLTSSGESDIGRLIMLKLGAVDDDPNAGSLTYNVQRFLVGDAYGRLGAPVGASISADIAAVDSGILSSTITGTSMTLEESLAYISGKVKSLWKVGN